MKSLAIILFVAMLATLAGAEDESYKVVPNTSEFPLPYQLPGISRTEAAKFDWKRYLDESKSKADRAFRARIAGLDYGQPISTEDYSNTSEAIRANLAATEFKGKCDDLIRRYRLKLKDASEVLRDLNGFINRSEEAISLQVEIVGGSWGGSGARVAYANSRMTAYLNYYRNLAALGASLHLQDLPK